MRKCSNISPYTVYEEAVSHIWLCNCSILNFLIYEENLIFFSISVPWVSLCMQDSIYLVGGWRDGPEGRLLVPEIDRNVTNHSKQQKSRWTIPPIGIVPIRINVGQKCVNRNAFKTRLNVLTRGRLQGDVVYLGWPIAPSYMSPNAGGRGGGCVVSANVYSCTHGAQINSGRSNCIFNLWCWSMAFLQPPFCDQCNTVRHCWRLKQCKPPTEIQNENKYFLIEIVKSLRFKTNCWRNS